MKEFLRKLIMMLMAVGFLAGFMILLYPLFSNSWNEAREEELRTDYQNTVTEAMKDKRGEEEWQRAWEYNANLAPIIIPDSFVQAENEACEDEAYMSSLNVAGDGVMGYISIPKIEVNIPISHSTSDEVLQKGAGHLHGSSLPAGGEDSHAVLAAHRGLPGASLFTDIDQLEKGDQFYLYILDDILAYEVDQILTVEPQDTEALNVVRGEDLVTLVTCTPYAVNSHRLLIRGHRVPYVVEKLEEQQTQVIHSAHTNYILWICIGLGSTLLFLMMFALVRRQIMKRWHVKVKLSSLVFLLFLWAAFGMTEPAGVYAEELQQKSCSIQILLQCEHEPVGECQVALYRVADMDMADGKFHIRDVLGSAVKDSELEEISIAEKNSALSEKFLRILTQNNIPPDGKGVTSADGCLTFTDLKAGLYLFCAEETKEIQTIPGLISIPQDQGTEKGWVFDITVEPKTVPKLITPVPTAAPEPTAVPEPTVTPAPTDIPAPTAVPQGNPTGNGTYSGASGAAPVKTADETPVHQYSVILLMGLAAAVLVIKLKKIYKNF